MEHLLLKNLETLTSSTSHHSKTLTLTRSLLTSPNTSPSALQSIIETLAQALDRHRQDATFARHAIKVIGDGAAHHRHLIPSAVGAIRPFLNAEHRVATDALAVVDSLGEYSVLDEELVVSLASSSAVSVRSRIVDVLGRNVDILRPELMMRVLLGIAADIYPLVRRGAVVGLTELLKRDENWIDVSVVKRCYDCAVEHMRDEDGVLRSAVVRLVSECARLFTVTDAGNGGELVNMIFVQLCWMARDMSLKVRMDAIVALGNVRQVAESVLLQSLSKKILPSKNGGCSLTGCSIKESKYPLSSAAGAFVHGIEDEFHEVRTAACKSMGLLSKFSVQFSDDALSLLMDMLNDDVTAVRLQTLETLIHMALHDHLMVQEKHMHMFLGSLADNCAVIRHAARKVLRLMTLRKPEMFISSVDALITNLVMHPEEEDDIFCVLFFIGINHGNFAARRVKKFEAEIVPFCEGDLSLDSPQAAALLVLAISLSFSDEKLTSDVPPTIFSFAVPLLGRISRSLRDVIHPDLLLAHLGNRSELSLPSRAESLPCVVEDGFPNIKERTSQICSSSWSIRNKTLETSFKGNLFDLAEASTLFEQCREHDDNFIQSIKLIIRTVAETWQLMQSQHTHKVQRILRTCKGELETIAWNADGSIAALLAFALCYVQDCLWASHSR